MKLYKAKDPGSPLVILHTFEDEGARVLESIRSLTDRDFSLAVISDIDWNRDLSPWPAKAVFKGEPDFEGRANEHLADLTVSVIPEILSSLPARPVSIYIAGYSLAGLFALYSLYECDIFDGAASCSGSLWYPDFTSFAMTHRINAQRVYLSLGSKESRTKNPVMATVENNTGVIYRHLKDKGLATVFELNEGGHFTEPVLRTARGIVWLINKAGGKP